MLESVVVWQHAWWDSGTYGAWWQTRARVPNAATNRCNRELLHPQARCNMQTQEANAKENVLQMPVSHVKQKTAGLEHRGAPGPSTRAQCLEESLTNFWRGGMKSSSAESVYCIHVFLVFFFFFFFAISVSCSHISHCWPP